MRTSISWLWEALFGCGAFFLALPPIVPFARAQRNEGVRVQLISHATGIRTQSDTETCTATLSGFNLWNKGRKNNWAGDAGPIVEFANSGSYFLPFCVFAGASPTFVVMPTPICCRESRPCLACAPIGPFGSRSMAC